MESYIEVSFLHNVVTIVLSVLLASYASLQPLSLKKVLSYGLLVTGVACGCWFAYGWCLLVIIEVLFFLFYFRYAWKTYVVALGIRFLLLYTAFAMYHGGFHNFAYFVPLHANVYVLWALYGFAFLLLFVKWKDFVTKLSYVYTMKLFSKQQVLQVKGYLDSGNLLCHKDVPILFIDKKYHEYFINNRIELVLMNTIADTDVIRCYECEVQLSGCKKHLAYINCDRTLQLPMKCEVLLNMKVMTLG